MRAYHKNKIKLNSSFTVFVTTLRNKKKTIVINKVRFKNVLTNKTYLSPSRFNGNEIFSKYKNYILTSFTMLCPSLSSINGAVLLTITTR